MKKMLISIIGILVAITICSDRFHDLFSKLSMRFRESQIHPNHPRDGGKPAIFQEHHHNSIVSAGDGGKVHIFYPISKRHLPNPVKKQQYEALFFEMPDNIIYRYSTE